MQRLVNCKLSIKSIIDNKEELTIVNGKGYCKEESDSVIIYFTSNSVKYKYVYNEGKLVIECNDSIYEFECGVKGKGKIKNGNYIFEITTLAKNMEIYKDKIILNYVLIQKDIIGEYFTELTIN